MLDVVYSFISTPYEDMMHTCHFNTNQALTLIGSFVKHDFEEIIHERVVACDDSNVNQYWFTTVKFLFVTLCTHNVVMIDFMKLSIKDHSSISSEMVKFVCYLQPSNGPLRI